MAEADSYARQQAANAMAKAKEAYSLANTANRTANSNSGKISKLEGRVGKLEGRMSKVESRLTSLESRVTTLENRVTELENIVRDLIGEVKRLQRNVVDGMNKVKVATDNVATQIVGNRTAMGKIEALRLFNEAEAPLNSYNDQMAQIKRKEFEAEMNISSTIESFDEKFDAALKQYDVLIKAHGSHIYQIEKEDFAGLQKEINRTIPLHQFQHGNLQVDAHRVDRRNEQLEGNLDEFKTNELDRRVNSMDIFDTQMEGQFAQNELKYDGDIYIPSVTVNVDEDSWEVFSNVRVNEEDEDEGVAFELVSDPSYAVVQSSIKKNLPKTLKSAGGAKDLSDSEEGALKAELRKMADQGLITEEILVGYLDYIDNFGVQVVK
jgi:uncharacterized coiled-coil protein SlyX